MPQFRQDPITGQWVSIAPQRARRPSDVQDAAQGSAERNCPFCQGREDQTPEEIFALRTPTSAANAPGWRVRVVANKYPFLAESSADPCGLADESFFPCRAAAGVHEVIIESPRHVTSVSELSVAELTDVLAVYRERLRALRRTGRWRYALLFKNSGAAAGASLAHLHSQLVALPDIPERIVNLLARSQKRFDQSGESLWGEMLRRELAAGERLVARTDCFVALCPFASRQPYEMLLLPAERAAHFSDLSDEALPELATLLRTLIQRLESALAPLAFNWMINTCPFDTIAQRHYHWHVEVVPRVTLAAGYEWASGYAVNAVPPEVAARRLREIKSS